VLAAFDFTSWYAYLAYAAAAYLLWRTFLGQLVADARAVRRKVRPEPPPPPPGPPAVTLTSISASTPLTQDEGAPHRRLAAIRPRYEIHNDGDSPLTDVTIGVRRSGTVGGGHQFDWNQSVIPPRAHPTVDGVEIPPEMFRDVHESVAQRAFVFWVRFNDHSGERWEVTRDAGTDQHEYLFRPPPLAQPQLDARVRKTGKVSYVMDIENTGDVAVEQVEVDLPPEATNWQLLTDALASYPIRVLEPGDAQAVPVAVSMGPHASIEVTVRGLVDGVPYERRRTVSVIG
jgi:hypothetical protein